VAPGICWARGDALMADWALSAMDDRKLGMGIVVVNDKERSTAAEGTLYPVIPPTGTSFSRPLDCITGSPGRK